MKKRCKHIVASENVHTSSGTVFGYSRNRLICRACGKSTPWTADYWISKRLWDGKKVKAYWRFVV